jgi:hypothetical protein
LRSTFVFAASIAAVILFASCKNPFAPDINYTPISSNTAVSDLKDPDGVFQNLLYAYTFKDTLIYGGLLHPNFSFTYRDYDLGYDVSWGRAEEIRITHGLFTNAERLDLIWNNILVRNQDSVQTSIVRSFNLTITFNPSDVVRVDGRVNLQLVKDAATKRWQILNWVDESNY